MQEFTNYKSNIFFSYKFEIKFDFIFFKGELVA